MNGLLGKKIGMACIFGEDGSAIPVTMIEVGPCYVTQLKTNETDGYNAVQLGYAPIKEKTLKKPSKGHFAKSGTKALKVLREFRDFEGEEIKLGDELTVELFSVGDRVNVSATSKGKGFAGTMKRHNFHGSQRTHGQSDRMRAPGSIGQSSNPSRVFKGMKMAGRMGNRRVTIKKIQVVRIDPKQNLLVLKGSVPGPKTGMVEIRKV